ncbi:MAG: EAL domain-containing protein [Pseudomonadota bacterium]|nr:EAL domain-containing protein [Pseudomonadota bacterium]
MRPPGLSLLSCIVVTGSLHLIAALLGTEASRQAGCVVTLWYANAVVVAILLGRPPAEWPWLLAAVAAAGMASDYALGNALEPSLIHALGNVVEIALACTLLRRWCVLRECLFSAGQFTRLLVLGGLVPAAVAASVATALLLAIGMDDPQRLWFSWMAASSIGAIAVLPLGMLVLVRGWAPLRADLLDVRVVPLVLLALGLSVWTRGRLPYPYAYVMLGLAASALIGRFPAAALAVMLTAVAMLLSLNQREGGGALPSEPLALMLEVLPVGLSLMLPMLLAVSQERIRQQLRDLAAREELARVVYQKTPAMMYTVDRDRRVIEVSDAWLERMGYRREDVVGRPTSDFMTAETRARAETEVLARFTRDGMVRDVEYQLFSAHGDIVDVLVSAIRERDADGRFLRAMAVFKDVTEQKRLAGELAREQERIAVTLHSIGDGVAITDEHGRVSYLNPVAQKLLGWTMADARGRAFSEVVTLFDQDSRELLLDPVAECLRDRHAVGLPLSAVMRDRNGREYAVEDSVAPILGSSGEILGTVMVFQDVTEKRELAQRMSHLALHDPLTDLPNRLLFHDRVQQLCQFARREGSQFAVMFMDLDHFKRINDSLGHVVGDELLKTVAKRLRQALRDSDTVCRLGGDEFVILLGDIEGDEAAQSVARKVLESLAETCVLEGTEVKVGVSLGIAMFPTHGIDPATLMKRADAAMYRSKRDGRNRFAVWSREMDEPAAARLQMESDIRRGLAHGEFLIHYQPVVSSGSLAPVGVEALVRWARGARGMEQPDAFIPIAEDSGLIIEMGAQLMREACAQLATWSGTPLGHLRIAVNVSAVQLSDPDFVRTVSAALERARVPGHLLEIEMTESTLIKDPERALQVLSALKQLGVRIAIDDFGTGYSSLSNLRLFPLDIVKIDRSFVADLERDADDRELVNAILAMSRSLRLDVVAEGVERDSQATILSAMKCPALQGFLFSVPADAARTTAWLVRREAASRNDGSPQGSLFG